jgi:GT2 family glycosyltransferase
MTAVSVIVRTLNSKDTIQDCLRSLFDQGYSDFEVLVVDDGSIDNTVQIAETFPVRVSHNLRGKNPCNLGIEQAKSEIVAFIDSDAIAQSDWLARIVDCFNDEYVAAVGGEEIAPPTSKYWGRCFEAIRRIEKKLFFHWGSLELISACNAAYRKSALMEVGGFNDYLHYGEETELNWRLSRKGWKILFDPELMVLHNRRSSLRKFFVQQFSSGVAIGRLVCMHPHYLKPSHAAMVLVLLTLILWVTLILSGKVIETLYLTMGFLALALVGTVYAWLLVRETRLVPGIMIAALEFVFARSLGFFAGIGASVAQLGARNTKLEQRK